MKYLTLFMALSMTLFTCIGNTSKSKEHAEDGIGQITEQQMEGFTVTDETIKKDDDGNVISNEKFSELMSTGEYVLNPKVENGKMLEAKLQKATPEQLKML
ncbi:MAG: hypothetical protein H6567_06620 [Lewinellaceae bacterium]|nr:hypothetical protein [Lewinellaceae bacterium]